MLKGEGKEDERECAVVERDVICKSKSDGREGSSEERDDGKGGGEGTGAKPGAHPYLGGLWSCPDSIERGWLDTAPSLPSFIFIMCGEVSLCRRAERDSYVDNVGDGIGITGAWLER